LANNTTLNTGTGGDTIATDDVAGVKYQRVKLMDGTEDSTAVITGDASNGLDVDVTRVSGNVTVVNGGTFSTQDTDKIADNAGFTDGTSKVLPAGFIFDEVAGTALTENDAAAARIDAKRAQVGVLEDATTRGQRASVSAGGALKVDNSAVTQPVSGSITADTELPAAATLADATANPSTTVIESMLACYNGTTWDRLRGDITNGLDVDVTRVTGTVTVANGGTFATQDSDKIVDNAGFTDGTSKVLMGGFVFDEVAGTALTENDAAAGRIDSKRAQVGVLEDASTRGQRAAISAAGALKVDNSAVTQPVSGNVGLLTRTSGGLSIFRSLDLNVTDVAVKASAGQVYGWTFANTGASFAWVKFYDASTASTTIGATTPVITFGIPGGAAANVFNDMGVAFATAITIGATTGIADADTTAPSANQVSGQVFYA
jgi:hypothetical protein